MAFSPSPEPRAPSPSHTPGMAFFRGFEQQERQHDGHHDGASR